MWDKTSPLLVGVDIGTSGVRAQAFALSGECVAEGRASFATSYPGDGRAEQEPGDWWLATVQALRKIVAHLGSLTHFIAGIGLTGQCPTFTYLLPSGETVGSGLVYQDNRAVAETDALIRHFGIAALHQRTGQAASPFYVLPKLLWLKQHQGRPPAGATVVQPRDLVAWHLTGRCATDPTHAACTLAYDLLRGAWATDWLAELGLQSLNWPEILAPDSVPGYLTAEAAAATGLTRGTPIVMGAADSICAAYSTGTTGAGVLCEVTGTSTCLHLTIAQPAKDEAINTYPHVLPGAWYAEAGLNTTGGALAWLTTLLGKSYVQLLQEASTIQPGAGGLSFLPHLSRGERDQPTRQGAFVGLQISHTSGHMARALLEGVAYALRQRVELLTTIGGNITRVISCGGGARSPLWTQIKADILGLPISLVSPTDTATWGAALLVSAALDLPVTASPFVLNDFQPDQNNTEAYRAHYERFCQLETLLTAAPDQL
ncbi:MAG TPA: FGGY family carbohydrate kinase [Ktedonobacteraceae bacterium]